jgi:hypothetical protein
MIVHGAWPDEIDHINGCPSDNRLINLRNVDHAGNCRNRRIRSDNTSGMVGVHRVAKTRKWIAYANSGGRRFCLGSFGTAEEATRARLAASEKHGFHPNHGRSAAYRAKALFGDDFTGPADKLIGGGK